MPRFDTGVVAEITESGPAIERLVVKVGRAKRKAVAFPSVSGKVNVGDKVILNTTATELKLGTGGRDFVLWNLANEKHKQMSKGHIMKMRYTPWQFDTMSVEAPESPHHEKMKEATSLGGMPVVACGLHSQVPAVAAMLKSVDPDLNVAYVMTDGAALPIADSEVIASLKEKKLIDGAVTTGHAFGGDLEAVNFFSGLLAASDVLNADAAIVSIGPGIVGTQTLLGHTGIQQGQVLSAAAALGGRPVGVLRVSFADPRPEHTGVSFHSITALKYATTNRCTVAIPDLPIDRLHVVMGALAESGISEMHDLVIVDAWETAAVLEKAELQPSTMGRTMAEDPDFFEAAGAAGLLAGRLIYEIDD